MSEERRILVVDDNYRILDSVKSMLESSSPDFSVIGVPSAEEGILELRKRLFDLLITDIYLPGMSGAELIVRVNKLWPELPIIVITGHAEKMSPTVAASSGIISYFEKPVKPGELIRSVKEAFHTDVVEVPPDLVEPVLNRGPKASLALRFLIEGLRADTGASEVLVGTMNGRILYATRGKDSALTVLIDNFGEATLGLRRLSDRMGCSSPSIFQTISDGQIELFICSKESGFLIALLYDAPSRISEIAAIKTKAEGSLLQVEKLMTGETEDAVQSVESATVEVTHVPRDAPSKINEPHIEEAYALLQALKEVSEQKGRDSLGFPELDDSMDVKAFWDDVLSDDSADGEAGKSLDFEEAIKRGLIPPGFNPQE